VPGALRVWASLISTISSRSNIAHIPISRHSDRRMLTPAGKTGWAGWPFENKKIEKSRE
jgi:hypothetical protein